MLYALSFCAKFDILAAGYYIPCNICHWLCNWVLMDESCGYGYILRPLIRFWLRLCWLVYRERGFEVWPQSLQKWLGGQKWEMQIHVYDLPRIILRNAYDINCFVWHLHWCCFHSFDLPWEYKSNMVTLTHLKYRNRITQNLLHGSSFDANVWLHSHCKRRGLAT